MLARIALHLQGQSLMAWFAESPDWRETGADFWSLELWIRPWTYYQVGENFVFQFRGWSDGPGSCPICEWLSLGQIHASMLTVLSFCKTASRPGLTNGDLRPVHSCPTSPLLMAVTWTVLPPLPGPLSPAFFSISWGRRISKLTPF